MKNTKLFVLGMLALALVFGLALAGCDTPSNGGATPGPLEGTWIYKNDYIWIKMVFTGNDWVESASRNSGSTYTNYQKGTYTGSAPTFTLNQTHSWIGDGWDSDSNTFSATLSGNTLTYNNGTYTKQP